MTACEQRIFALQRQPQLAGKSFAEDSAQTEPIRWQSRCMQRLNTAAPAVLAACHGQRHQWEAVHAFVDLPDLVRRDLALLARQVLRLVAVDQLLDARLERVRVLRLRDALLREN